MGFQEKAKKWLQENAPNLVENKYLGMVYDRFASLPPNQQRWLTLGSLGTVCSIILIWLFSSYLTYFEYTGRANGAQKMLSILAKYEAQKSDSSSANDSVQRNTELLRANALKNFIMGQARIAKISTRSIEVDERMGGSAEEPGGPKSKMATVKLQRVNLDQLLEFVKGIEFGIYSIGISSVKIDNDEKYRGYMNAEFSMVAHLLEPGGVE